MNPPVLTREQWKEIYYVLNLAIYVISDGVYRGGKVETFQKIQEIIGPDGENMVTP